MLHKTIVFADKKSLEDLRKFYYLKERVDNESKR